MCDRLSTMDDQMNYHSLMAQYWMSMAVTGHAKNRSLFHGTDGPEFTETEKIGDALDTALRQINLVKEIGENKAKEMGIG